MSRLIHVDATFTEAQARALVTALQQTRVSLLCPELARFARVLEAEMNETDLYIDFMWD